MTTKKKSTQKKPEIDLEQAVENCFNQGLEGMMKQMEKLKLPVAKQMFTELTEAERKQIMKDYTKEGKLIKK